LIRGGVALGQEHRRFLSMLCAFHKNTGGFVSKNLPCSQMHFATIGNNWINLNVMEEQPRNRAEKYGREGNGGENLKKYQNF
jgi:hypothetical protein